MPAYRYLAILGRQPELGLIELESLLGADALMPFGHQAALITDIPRLDRLGGVMKLGIVVYDGTLTDVQALPLPIDDLAASGTKITFGVSLYGQKAHLREATAIGLALKKRLRQHVPVRFVAPAEGAAITAAQLKFNHILENGFELLVVRSQNRLVLALTQQIQDIDWYSRRDYDRPERSAKVGMLPPKLAQVLINTTAASVVVDPFCGTGVVLQEALLMDRVAYGSDLSGEMVAASRENLAWLATETNQVLPAWHVEAADARSVQLPDLAAAIVTEGYLGPNLSHQPSEEQLRPIMRDLAGLYTEALTNWASQLDSGAELALCVPAWRVNGHWRPLSIVDDCKRLGYTVKVFKHVKTPILYSRADQVVGRQLLLLRKK